MKSEYLANLELVETAKNPSTRDQDFARLESVRIKRAKARFAASKKQTNKSVY